MSSSPLAAMHHAPVPAWGQRQHHGNRRIHSPTINIRNSLLLNETDYFSGQQVRGSSPSLSLAADLSENFRIDNDASPRFPTPRRALFSRNTGTRGYVTTTPPHQKDSSPMSMGDSMDVDMTPIPDKRGACSTLIEVTSPTPMHSPGDEMMLESPIPPSRQGTSSLEPPKLFHDRRRAGARRPSLSKTKGFSTSALLTRANIDGPNTSQAFRLGSSPDMTPGECFEGSPPRPQSATTPSRSGGPRSKAQFASLTGSRDIRNGSPVAQHSRRPSNPSTRSRRQCQRTQSMFENMEELENNVDHACHGGDEDAGKKVPHFYLLGQLDCLPRLKPETFIDFMDGKFDDDFTQKVVIDCRFDYEYNGGHIDGAVNYSNHELLIKHLFDVPMGGKPCLIFHCEYSAHRAPMMARVIRSYDRECNRENFPHLDYPSIYVLDGGYRQFFELYRNRCYPQSYVEMNDAAHIETCERELDRLACVPKITKRKGLSRAQTYAFGARDEMMLDDSPTGPSRRVEHQSPVRMIGNSPILGRSPRRFASY
ncbi:hypothetical protein F4809DRAFT_473992 [Biscogniauxia mediterranea]|nr:hypothetical protein F4809DRAFT_473992 [Biscogniauxia mediterranea]